MNPVEVSRGDGPVVLGMPHGGTHVPPSVWDRLNDRGRALADTDWHIGRLYEGLVPGATVVRGTLHRTVIDVNRDPTGQSLYPGQATTGLVPLTDFDGQPIWSREPEEGDVALWREAAHRPYHAALAAELARVRERHGVALLWDCHSIRSRIPFLFEGVLPDLNIGTYDGRSCAPEVEAAAHEFAASSPFSTVLNGRFKGGWTTRAHGRPGDGVHAVQMEIAQGAYLSEEAPPWTYDEGRAARLRRWLSEIVEAARDAALETRGA